MLTIEKLDAMRPETMIAHGICINCPDDIFMTRSNIGREMIWVAMRGEVSDWTIYVGWKDTGLDRIISNGDKLHNEKHIRKLVPCTVEAYERYRF